ncbi:cache domain-containing protein [Pseudoalteromonas xiamenensis]|uniref:cache domain-containing protein n=1 Tax=Pseudoalteromonas xiamenensis TaxID=882626 RepID=UPI0035EFA30C
MIQRVSWLIACLVGGFIPVALALAHVHFSASELSHNKADALFQTVESVVSNTTLKTAEKQAKLIDIIAKADPSDTTFFVYDTNGKMIFHPTHPEFNGRVLTSHANPIVAGAFRHLVKSANAYPEAVVSYHWQSGVSGKIESKVAYIRRIDNWNWVFAASVVEDEAPAWQMWLVLSLLFCSIVAAWIVYSKRKVK